MKSFTVDMGYLSRAVGFGFNGPSRVESRTGVADSAVDLQVVADGV